VLTKLLAAARWTVFAAGLLLLAITFTPLVEWAGARFTTGYNEADGDVLIVLMGSTVDFPAAPGGLVMGENTYWRAVYAIHAWKRGHFCSILLSGGGATAVKTFLLAEGIPEIAMYFESRSNSTRENALFAKPLLEHMQGRRVLITSDYHTRRAAACFAKVGIAVVPRPAPDVLKRALDPKQRWVCFWDLALEFTKGCWYRLHGWI
jgi:uncharacterized SAM-binding protein YcdF (DUF218 family)